MSCLIIKVSDETSRLNIGCSILCSVTTVNDGYEVFEASDGRFILDGGESFKVIKEDGIQK